MDIIAVVIGGLATWRVSLMIVKEVGPAAIFIKLRAFLASRQKQIGGMFDLVSCVSCTSIYIGAVTSLAFARTPLDVIMYTLSFSAVSVIIERLNRYDNK